MQADRSVVAPRALPWLLLLYRGRHAFLGLFLMASYAILGLDGLLHYIRAPMAAHRLRRAALCRGHMERGRRTRTRDR